VLFNTPEVISSKADSDSLKIIFWNLDAFKGQSKDEYLCEDENDELCKFIAAEEARKKQQKSKSRRLEVKSSR
jgi:hypothetical protein